MQGSPYVYSKYLPFSQNLKFLLYEGRLSPDSLAPILLWHLATMNYDSLRP